MSVNVRDFQFVMIAMIAFIPFTSVDCIHLAVLTSELWKFVHARTHVSVATAFHLAPTADCAGSTTWLKTLGCPQGYCVLLPLKPNAYPRKYRDVRTVEFKSACGSCTL